MAVTASPRAYPSASAEKVLHEPSGERMPFSVIDCVVPGAIIKVHPATMAPSQTPCWMAAHASLRQVNADEQAVRIVILRYVSLPECKEGKNGLKELTLVPLGQTRKRYDYRASSRYTRRFCLDHATGDPYSSSLPSLRPCCRRSTQWKLPKGCNY